MADGGAARPAGPTALRIILGTQLRRLREAAEISPAEASARIRGSKSKISRLELGRVGLKERDVEDLLTLYGVTDSSERRQFLEMVKQSNEPGWWYRFADLMPEWFQDYVGLEEAAIRILTCELQFVPGLMQTEHYARAIATSGHPALATEDAEWRVTLRMRRQKVLHRPAPPRLWAVIDESVLHRPLGGREVLIEQIDHLLELTTLPHVTLQVVPYALSGYAAEGAFTMLRFAEPELPDIVYIEHLTGAFYLDKRDDVEQYGRVFDQLTVDAATPRETRQLLMKARASV
ncbi:helix-turn-helix domain-containing protein [Kibdelosporangium philippinense]|uniref:Helix-turn-helix domain-containing protein n=1 Tax=Kibdelosporangium philippinense TaxID=211113 RepID=A0ABS8ZTY0_9PSEU|nr:helix-turn-helix transcriptional regulator [Kibdelosporangium philippinense]MCE7011190.1 helix-turn-helix domain-containing protein [Kibdelosporangium philippinense]